MDLSDFINEGPRCLRGIAAVPAVAAILLCGCATTTPYSIEKERDWLPALDGTAGVSRLPLTVGLYVPPTIADQPLSVRRGNATVTFTANGTVVPYFVWATEQMFAKAIRLSAFAPDASLPDGLSAVIELSEVGPTWMKVTLYERGQERTDWSIEAYSAPLSTADAAEPAVRDVTYRLRDAIAQYLLRFLTQPGVKAWIEREGIATSAGPAQANVADAAPAAENYVLAGDEAGGMSCVGNHLARLVAHAKFAPLERIRLGMFPWFEASVAPGDDDAEAFWARAEIRHRARSNGLRYLMEFSGGSNNSKNIDAVGCGAYGCFGLVTGTRRSQFRAVLRDLWRGSTLLDERVEKSGDFAVPWLLLPIPLIPATQASACDELAQRILRQMPAPNAP